MTKIPILRLVPQQKTTPPEEKTEEGNSQFGWEDKRVAETYNNYGQQFTMYKLTSEYLVDLVQISPGETIVDLACGTGITTTSALVRIGRTGEIFAIDMSGAMLEKAKLNVRAENIEFIQARSERIARVIPRKVDCVICNSAFWQFPQKEQTLRGIRQILKPEGRFVFNLPEQVFDFGNEDVKVKSTVTALNQEIEQELGSRNYTIEKPKHPTRRRYNYWFVIEMLGRTGFRVEKYDIFRFERPLEEIIEFFKIPTMGTPMLKSVPYEERVQVLNSVKEKLEEKGIKVFPSRWAYFVCRPIVHE
ncbi:MAG: methyltransferase domain-containing protein [Candidatus Cloacimonetes bacterium]|nr:methyltransferase domain-containing protein [Candidatus Cloacimonadota bacterium]